MPAAAVIPTLKVYVKVVAVKTLVVRSRGVYAGCAVPSGAARLRPAYAPIVTLNKP